MKNATLPVLLGGASVVILVIAFLFTGNKDKEGPEIKFTDECISVFTDEDDANILLNGVKAVDKKDGDVTETLRIQNISVLLEDGKIIVHYSAKDNSNNIVKAEKAYDYTGTKEYIDFSLLDEEIFAEDILDTDESSSETSSEQQTSTTEETSSTEESTSNTVNNEDETTSVISPITDETPINKDEVNATGIPQIRMKYHEIKIPVGGSFYFMDALKEWYDDKDDVSRRVIVDGVYDVNVPGTYTLKYYVTDSDRNISNIETLTLIVE